jgi:pimeloyl-ACP methyl ester carboxylesterase
MPTLTRDGHALFYRKEGRGEPPVVLVHGWCCDHTYLEPQLEHFRPAHRVVAVDLLGHGRSDKPVQPYSIRGFADDVAWMCRELGVKKPLVVGHSMGGVVSVELAARHPDLVQAVVVLDSITIPTPDRRPELEAQLAAFQGPDYAGAMRDFLPGFFSTYDDPERCARIEKLMAESPQHVAAAAFAGLIGWDGVAALSACKVPALYIAATSLRTDLEHLRALCPQLLTAQVVGAGHFLQLEVPDQVNAMLDRFLEIVLRKPA